MKIDHPLRLDSAEFNQHPHAHFAWMRDNEPVYKAKLNWRTPVYLITRYDDVSELLLDNDRLMKNPRTAAEQSGKSASMWLPKSFRPLMHNMLNTDEPDHRRLRNLVHKAFTPRMIRTLHPRIEAITHELLEKAAAKPNIDLLNDFALPLPVTVIAEMLGIPAADHAQFRYWAERIVVNPTPFNMAKAIPAIRNFMRYIRDLADKRRADPQDDVISGLALAEDEGDKLTEDELAGTVFLLLIAGHETTVGLIANGARALIQNQDQLAKLRADASLMDSAIEEMLRYDGPLQTTEFSFARKAFTLRGVDIPHGTMLLPSILSANRDATVFDNPDVFDVTRTPNKHLAFGQGIHYCLGAPLARMEAKVAFCALLEHAPNLRMTIPESELSFHNMPLINRMQALPVAF